VLTTLRPRIKNTIIQFDELHGSDLNLSHEWQALNEFVEESGLDCIFIGHCTHAAAVYFA